MELAVPNSMDLKVRSALIDQITQFADHVKSETIVDRLHPVVRLVVPIVAMIGVLVSGNMYVFYAFALLVGIIAVALGVGKSYWTRFAFITVTISFFTFLIRGFFDYGSNVIFRVGPFTYTYEGLDSALWYTAMLLAVCAPIVLAICTLSLEDGTEALSTLGAPKEAAYITMNAVRMIPELGAVSRSVQDAQRSRGIQVDGGRLVRLKALVPSIVPLVLSSLSGVEERAIAMEVRGFGIPTPSTALRPRRKLKGRDMLIMGVVLVLAIAAAIVGRIL